MVTGKRGVFDVLRRSVDNTIANWQLILIRFGEMLLFGVLAILTMIAAFMPILVAVGIEISKLTTISDVENAALALMEKWYLLGWVVVAILVLMTVVVAIHAFVEAGSARVYVDAERIAGPAMTGARSRFRVFSTERWLAGAKDGWWTLFWIYNIAWLYYLRGEYSRAIELLHTAAGTARRTGDGYHAALSLLDPQGRRTGECHPEFRCFRA